MKQNGIRLTLLLLILTTGLIAGTAHAQIFMNLNGSAEGDWDSPQFPNQSFDVPLEGSFAVMPAGEKKVRITGSYRYEIDIQHFCSSWFGWCPSWLLLPYPFDVETTVNLIATIGSQNGNTVYRAPTGTIFRTTWLGVFDVTYSQTFRNEVYPDLILRPSRTGWDDTWFSVGPKIIGSGDTVTELYLSGSY